MTVPVIASQPEPVALSTEGNPSANLPKVTAGIRRWVLLALTINGAAQALLAVANAVLVRFVYDNLLSRPAQFNLSSALAVAAAFTVLATLLGIMRARERVDAERLAQEYIHEVRLLLFRHLGAQPMLENQKRSSGATMLRFVGDLSGLRQWISQGLARLMVAGVTLCLTLAWLLSQSATVGLTVTVVLICTFLLMALQGTALRNSTQVTRRRRSQLAADIQERITALSTMQAFGQLRREEKRISKKSLRLKQAMLRRASDLGRLRGLSDAAGMLASAAALLAGMVEVSSGRLSTGSVVACMSVVGLLVPSLRDLGRVQEYRQGGRVASLALRRFLARPTLERDGTKLRRGNGAIEFREVSVSGILHGINAIAQPGQTILIDGPNGSGKTTLLHLAARLNDPEEGNVLLSGVNIRRVSLRSLHRLVGMVSPDLPLLRGTVRRNVLYRNPKASETELAALTERCELETLYAELPNGADTRLQEGGRNLSFGQRQRLMLARALLCEPPVLLLDEPDSNLDEESVLWLRRVLEHYPGTVLLISHHPALRSLADDCWVLNGGRLVNREFSAKTNRLPMAGVN